MFSSRPIMLAAASAASAVQALSLADVCTPSYVASHLPASDFHPGLTLSQDAKANPVYNTSVSGQRFYPDATFDYCNVTLTYSHNGIADDEVVLTYWLPAPENFQNRYLSTGGGAYAINSGIPGSLPGGIIYGAVSGMTDGGFGIYANNSVKTFLAANGTENLHNIYMLGYRGIEELSIVGKAFTKTFFNMTDDAHLYAYYQGCSEGGREGLSQVQRFPDEWDGAIIGAPAIRYAFQQVQHLYANVVEQTMGYYPPPCELEKIMNETIKACDTLDGRADGVVSRTDLCTANYNINATIGAAYSCPPQAATNFSPALPAQNGTVTAQGVALAQTLLEGPKDSQGRRVYVPYQPGSAFTDATTSWDETTQSWGLFITSLGGTFVEVLLNLEDGSNLPSLTNVTVDTLRDWIYQGWQKYEDVLQTTWPDLTSFQQAGGKIIHYHGESDFSIPTASSVRYWDSVRSVVYSGETYNASTAAMNDWYRLFLVPGASHCAPNNYEPNAPFPNTNLAALIAWVEGGAEPQTLNATVLLGGNAGEKQQICSWPLRPYWTNNGTAMECRYDQQAVDSFSYDLDAFKMPVY